MRSLMHRPQWGCALSVCLFCSAALAAPGDPDDGGPPQQQTTDIAGRVENLNLNTQRGELDGVILSVNGTRVQVNLPESVVDAIAKAVAVGDVVQATVTPEGGGPGREGPGGRGGRGAQPDGRGPGPAEQPADHPVFKAVSFRDAHGKLYVAQDHGPGGGDDTYGGRVKALNYDHRGAINGVQLLNGDLIKLPPNNASLTLRPGDEVSVTGSARTIANGTHLIDAKTLNGADLRPPPPARGGRGPDANGPGPGGPDEGGRGGRGGRGRGPGPQADDGPPRPDEGPPPPPEGGPPGPPPPDEGPPEPGEGPPPQMQEPFRPQYVPQDEPPEDFGPPPRGAPPPPDEGDDADF